MIKNRQLSLYLDSPGLPEKVSLEAARPEDAEKIYREAEAVIDAYEDFSAVNRERALKWTKDSIFRYLDEYSRILYEGETAGYFGRHAEDTSMYIDDIYLFPSFRGLGIGTYLIRKTIEETNLDVVLHVFKNNVRALDLYRRLGFTAEREYDHSRYLMVYRQIPEDDDIFDK